MEDVMKINFSDLRQKLLKRVKSRSSSLNQSSSFQDFKPPNSRNMLHFPHSKSCKKGKSTPFFTPESKLKFFTKRSQKPSSLTKRVKNSEPSQFTDISKILQTEVKTKIAPSVENHPVASRNWSDSLLIYSKRSKNFNHRPAPLAPPRGRSKSKIFPLQLQ